MRRNPGVLWRAGDQFLVLGRVDGTVVTAIGPAVDVWELLDLEPSFDEIVQTLAGRYGADASTVATDLAPFVAQLLDQGFVIDA